MIFGSLRVMAITNIKDAQREMRSNLDGSKVEVCLGASTCVICGKAMPVCWDVVCFVCGNTVCYACAVVHKGRWYCKQCR